MHKQAGEEAVPGKKDATKSSKKKKRNQINTLWRRRLNKNKDMFLKGKRDERKLEVQKNPEQRMGSRSWRDGAIS